MSNKVFAGGVPYAVDVKRLMEAWPVDKLTEDTTIPHDELEGALNMERGAQRYYGVINSWMAKIKNETGIYMVWEQGDGVKVLTPSQLLGHAETRTKQKIKQTGRAIKTFAWVKRERLDETGQRRLDHQMRVASAIKEAMGKARQQLAVDLAPIKSLPKPRIVGGDEKREEAAS